MRIRARSLLGALSIGLLFGYGGLAVEGSSSTDLAAAAQSTITVTNTNDSGAGSLRQAISDSLPGGTIDFDSALNGQTVTLTSAELLINQNLSINGPGAHLLSVSGNNARRMFNVASGTVSIAGLTLLNGRAPGSFPLGGAILSRSTGTLFVSDVVIRNNVADSGGGGIAIVEGTGTIENSTFISNNTGQGFGGAPGGGLYVTGPPSVSVTVNNSTFYGNQAVQGGGVAPWAGTTNLNNVTIAGNTANFGNCGGIRFGGTVILNNSIVAGNTDQNGACDLSTFAGTISGDYNFIKNPGSVNFTSGGSQNILGQDPLLGALGDNGGTTPTMALCTAPGVPSASCLDASPAINTANPATPGTGGGACEAVDQRGVLRPLDDNGNGVFVCDIGAYEAPGDLTGPDDQTIDVATGAPESAAFGTTFGVAATATSGLDVAITTSGGCAGGGLGTATITMNSGTAACVVHFNQAGNDDYNPAPEVTNTTIASPADQTIEVTTAAPPSATFNSTFQVAASASSGLVVAITTSDGCSGSGSGFATITMTSGTTACVVHYNQSGNADFNPAPELTDTTSTGPASQTISVTMAAPASAAFDSTFAVAATASSGLAVAITTTDGCNGSGSGSATITMTSGTTACVVHYNQSGSANYTAASEVTSSTSAGPASQTISVTTAAPGSATFNGTFGVAATASSTLAVAITTTGGCSGSGSGTATITMTSGTTACVVRYNQAGNANYAAAPEVTSSVTAQKAAQTIGFAPLANRKLNQSPVTVAATASSGLTVTFTTTTPATCQSGGANGATITLVAVGLCTVKADQSGNANYGPAPSVSQSFTVGSGKADQTITFASLPNRTLAQSPFPIAATASSGLSVSFTAAPSAVCRSSGPNGATITLTGVGTCTVQANQTGNTAYNAAPSISQSFTVSKAAQVITFAALSNRPLSQSPFTVSATSSSGLSVTFTTTTPSVCTSGGKGGATIQLVATGTCSVKADQAGNSTYDPAPSVIQSFTVTP